MEESRVDISDKLDTLKKLSIKVLTEMVLIMRMLINEDNDLTDEITHNLNLPNENTNKVNEWLRSYSEDLVATSRSVKDEIGKFKLAYDEGDEMLDKKMNEYPLLSEVWYGDTYGKSGIDGLNLLIRDLENDLQNANEGKIIELGCKQKFE